jgi:hypothetical protein
MALIREASNALTQQARLQQQAPPQEHVGPLLSPESMIVETQNQSAAAATRSSSLAVEDGPEQGQG